VFTASLLALMAWVKHGSRAEASLQRLVAKFDDVPETATSGAGTGKPSMQPLTAAAAAVQQGALQGGSRIGSSAQQQPPPGLTMAGKRSSHVD
jgi:hypothetical protein